VEIAILQVTSISQAINQTLDRSYCSCFSYWTSWPVCLRNILLPFSLV